MKWKEKKQNLQIIFKKLIKEQRKGEEVIKYLRDLKI